LKPLEFGTLVGREGRCHGGVSVRVRGHPQQARNLFGGVPTVRAAPITFSDDALKPASIDGVIVTASLVDLDLGIRTGSGRANRVISAKRAGMSASVSSPKRW
jgi:hypothetical protein